MPYISTKAREYYRYDILNLVNKLKTVGFPAGDMNFIFSMLAGHAYLHASNYQKINDVVGALEGAKLEYYRRVAQGHEDLKVLQNSDIEVYDEIAKRLEAEFSKLLPVENSK